MSERIASRLSAAAWLVPLLWVAAWALFRGAFAHGGYVWWETVHINGALVLLVGGLAVRTFVWRQRIGGCRSVAAFGASQVALVTVVILANWLCFQAGLAYHCPPTSSGDFFWQDP